MARNEESILEEAMDSSREATQRMGGRREPDAGGRHARATQPPQPVRARKRRPCDDGGGLPGGEA